MEFNSTTAAATRIYGLRAPPVAVSTPATTRRTTRAGAADHIPPPSTPTATPMAKRQQRATATGLSAAPVASTPISAPAAVHRRSVRSSSESASTIQTASTTDSDFVPQAQHEPKSKAAIKKPQPKQTPMANKPAMKLTRHSMAPTGAADISPVEGPQASKVLGTMNSFKKAHSPAQLKSLGRYAKFTRVLHITLLCILHSRLLT